MPRLVIIGLLAEMRLTRADCGKLSDEEIATALQHINTTLAVSATYPFHRHGISYLDWTNTIGGAIGERIRHYAYYLMLGQFLRGKFHESDDTFEVLVAMAPHLNWFSVFPQTVVLDGTAHLTPYLYADYTIIAPTPWNYTDIEAAYSLYTGAGHNQTKAKITKEKETFVADVQTLLGALQETGAFTHPYIVTYKHLYKDKEELSQALSTLLGMDVQYYGSTRGSNAYRDTDSVILLGAYRPPVEFDTLARQMYPNYCPETLAVANWIQEMYRSRIRKHNGERIALAVLGEHAMVKLFQEEIGKIFLPLATAGRDEALLQGEKQKTQKVLYLALKKDGYVDVKDFATRHTQRNQKRVWRALEHIKSTYPELKEHLVGQPGESVIVVEKKEIVFPRYKN
jgi:hypothetical protein